MQNAVCTIASMVSVPSAKNVSFRVQKGTQGTDVLSYDFSRKEGKNLHCENSIWSSEQSPVSPFINEEAGSRSHIPPYDFGPVAEDTLTGRTQPAKASANSFSESERSGRYPMVNRTTNDATIASAFDQATNPWRHGAGTGSTIKGSIVHENISRNIEVIVPFFGTRTSEEVEIDGVTFQLRCGPNVVSIKANRNVRCNQNTTFFAFGIA